MNNDLNMYIYPAVSKDKTLEDYENSLRYKEIIAEKFDIADTEGNLYKSVRINGEQYKIWLKLDDLYLRADDANKREEYIRLRSKMMNRTHYVIVKEIEGNNIYLSVKLAKQIMQERVYKAIIEGIRSGKPVELQGYIIDVVKEPDGKVHRLVVNIAGVALRGYIFPQEWSTCYCSNLAIAAARVGGDPIKFKVYDILSKKEKKYIERGDDVENKSKIIFACSRKQSIDYDPWENINGRYPKGSIVNLTCLELRKENFFAAIDGLQEVEVLCVYPENFKVEVGKRYQGFVKSVDESKKLILVKPFNKQS